VHDDQRDDQLAYERDRWRFGKPAVERRFAVGDTTLLSVAAKS
jgi:hypothetical protein